MTLRIVLIVFITFAFVLPSVCAEGKEKRFENKLVLRGKVLNVHREEIAEQEHLYNIELEAEQEHLYNIELELEFFNSGEEPIVILQPSGRYIFWLGGVRLARTEADAKLFKYFYKTDRWLSVSPFPEYKKLAEQLDKPRPPSDVTWLIKPKESRFWKTNKAKILLYKKPDNFEYANQQMTEMEILNLPQPITLQVALEMWPSNIENFKPDFGVKLRKRWQKDGVFYLENKSNGYWFWDITSEPIALDLSKAK